MKKFLTATLAFIIFVTFSTYVSAYTQQIIIRSEKELSELRIMAEADEEKLQDYLRKMNHRMNGMRSREDVVKFLDFVDSLPVPHIMGTKFEGILYHWNSPRIFISFFTDIGEVHSFYFSPSSGNSNTNRELLFKLPINQEEYINVYSFSTSQGFELNDRGTIFFRMEIGGFIVRAGYNRGGNRNILTVNPEEMYKDMTVTSIKDLTWIVPYQVGDTYGEGFVTTANALEILRFVVGLPNDIEGRPQAMAAADVNGDGVIDAADALEILRFVVGLPNAITGFDDVEVGIGAEA
jgi:hypothetical protein